MYLWKSRFRGLEAVNQGDRVNLCIFDTLEATMLGILEVVVSPIYTIQPQSLWSLTLQSMELHELTLQPCKLEPLIPQISYSPACESIQTHTKLIINLCWSINPYNVQLHLSQWNQGSRLQCCSFRVSDSGHRNISITWNNTSSQPQNPLIHSLMPWQSI